MNILVVYTHPNRNSLNKAFLNSTVKGLKNNSKVEKVEVLDLYEENFDPVLIFNDEKKRRDLYLDKDLTEYRRQIKEADSIVFIYPIWWSRPPAMLLGYIDRLFSTNFAYKKIKGKIYPEGLLKGKKVYCISTMAGPTGYIQLTLGNAHKILMKRALFNYVGIKKVKFFEFGDMEKKMGSQNKKIKKIEQYMAKI